MKITCTSCDIAYRVISDEAEDQGIDTQFCPYCGEEDAEELDFED